LFGRDSEAILKPMAKARPMASVLRTRRDAVAVAQLAARQRGAVSRAQLRRCGLADATIARWVEGGRLHRIHPGVYAVGHDALVIQGRLIAALLYVGPGSAMSHATGVWWWQLLDSEPATIHLSSSGRRRSVPGVHVHRCSDVSPVMHRGLPVTKVARTLRDAASTLPFSALRRALAEADHRRLCDPGELASTLGRGQRGSAALRRALALHIHELARTLSVLEERFLDLLQRSGLPMPEVNARVGELMVDALWREARAIVELDGHATHDRPAAIEEDRRRELALRARGYVVLRYTWAQVTQQPDAVLSDLRATLAERVQTP
jgi:very-short-patch-repair endonuclease